MHVKESLSYVSLTIWQYLTLKICFYELCFLRISFPLRGTLKDRKWKRTRAGGERTERLRRLLQCCTLNRSNVFSVCCWALTDDLIWWIKDSKLKPLRFFFFFTHYDRHVCVSSACSYWTIWSKIGRLFFLIKSHYMFPVLPWRHKMTKCKVMKWNTPGFHLHHCNIQKRNLLLFNKRQSPLMRPALQQLMSVSAFDFMPWHEHP